jgi:lipoprotein-anchoring transpeptidase ErfK/SrfK
MKSKNISRQKTSSGQRHYSSSRSNPHGDSQRSTKVIRNHRRGLKIVSLVVFFVVIGGLYTAFRVKTVQAPAISGTSLAVTKKAQVTAAPINHCSDNNLSQLVLVSISQRHLWACNGSVQAYDSPVITGMDFLAADLTPTGTYHIYAKATDVYLKGSDSTGSWDDYVNYWMPFLDNQYGAYGFHDATWRAANAFGKISPASSNASHGCVECPLATAAWLYNWSQIGTTVTIEA